MAKFGFKFYRLIYISRILLASVKLTWKRQSVNVHPQNFLSLDRLTISLCNHFVFFFPSWSYGVLLWEMATLGMHT